MELATNNIEHQKKALLISSVLYLLFLAALFFFKIMQLPKEEEMALGVDLNYGIDLTGYGNIQTTNKANNSPNNYDVKPADKSTETKPQVQKTVTPSSRVTKTTQTVKPNNSKASAVITSEADDSPVTVKKTTSTSTPSKSTTTPTPVVSEPVKPARSVDQGSVMKKSGTGSTSNGTTGTRDGIGGNNNGDGKPGAVGDQGDPRGTLDGKSLYGNPGSGGSGGASVSISGWNKKNLTLPKDNTSETGRIVFEVTVDSRGDVVSIVTKQSTVSPSVTDFYKSYLQRRLSSYLTPQGTPPPRSKGTITINITNG